MSPWEWEAGQQSVKRKADGSLCLVFLWLLMSQQILLFIWGGNTRSAETRMDAYALPLVNRQTPRGWERTRAEGLNHSRRCSISYFYHRQNPSQKQLKRGEWVYLGPQFESHVGEGMAIGGWAAGHTTASIVRRLRNSTGLGALWCHHPVLGLALVRPRAWTLDSSRCAGV